MARASRTVVQVERLRDQVYNLVREDLKSGVISPGERIVEAELASRYGVSRTPVREALFQLSRDGLLSLGADRGYIAQMDTPRSAGERHEVRELLDPRLASHAAQDGTDEQIKVLTKAFEREKSAHKSSKHGAFIEANYEFRDTVRAMCSNQLLARCSALIDDQFQAARNVLYRSAENRAMQIKHDEKLLQAIKTRNPKAAEEAMLNFIAAVRAPAEDVAYQPPR